jgi:hypothetical protein
MLLFGLTALGLWGAFWDVLKATSGVLVLAQEPAELLHQEAT